MADKSFDPTDDMMQWFDWQHLPTDLQAVSQVLQAAATAMHKDLKPGSEKTAGMRKLLEAKDAFVRQAIRDRPPAPSLAD
jgi:hypothetical protein